MAITTSASATIVIITMRWRASFGSSAINAIGVASATPMPTTRTCSDCGAPDEGTAMRWRINGWTAPAANSA